MESISYFDEKSLQHQIIQGFSSLQNDFENKYPAEDLLKIDLHCHDCNSDVPDEILGRILNVPETWLETEKLIEILKQNQVTALTITNHNNSRSCYQMQEKGIDILTAAEFTCMVPDFNVGIHVLTYGFTAEQEKVLLKLRRNLYTFLQYTHVNNIPTIWAHPLYYYSENIPSMDFFEKLSIIFERFEVLNGQRDTWQNLLTHEWIKQLTPEKIDEWAVKHNVDLKLYTKNPYKKSFSGGSDSHIGLFAGETGTYLYVPNLSQRLKDTATSILALEALRAGNMIPYGNANSSEKLTLSLLDYVCQIALNSKDPGLLRILLHKGTTNDKFLALAISNAFLELQHHGVTMKFIELFHQSLMGKKPKLVKRWFISKNYKPAFDQAVKLAVISRKKDRTNTIIEYQETINEMHKSLAQLLFSRLDKKIKNILENSDVKSQNINTLIKEFEIPSELRRILGHNEGKKKKKNKESNAIIEFLDGLSFPFLASGLILAAHFTSAKVLFNNRRLLSQFSENLNKYKQPKKMLWLTDTFNDKNGVSMFLQTLHREIKQRNLPIDILVCSNTLQPDDHLIVVDPLMSVNLPMYQNQNINVPDFLNIHQIFHKNEYDRIICSTEGIMGVAALYLKNAFSVPAHFYIHTDWITFGRTVLNIDRPNLNRFRRMLRAYYKGFDNLFVLNTEQQKWLTGREMNMDSEKVHVTAHWTDEIFKPFPSQKESLFGIENNELVLLYAGRVSLEKGVLEIIRVYKQVKSQIENLKLVIVGTGPALEILQSELPDALFMGWVNQNELPAIYSSADLLILPSRFDTFSCVVLEAMACGLPVIAYNTKGPKDIINNEINGYLVSDIEELTEKSLQLLSDKQLNQSFKEQAVIRAQSYSANNIIEQLLKDVNLID